ncbi:MAG: aminopeptidase P family protein [Polyangiaceae bacterium]
MWSPPTPVEFFQTRRRKLRASLRGPAVVPAGWARPRNFRANRYPYRADSHFLYLVGAHLEGAVLVLEPDSERLYVEPPDPAEALWTGPTPSLDESSRALGIEIRPLEELELEASAALLHPQDRETASWLEERMGRPVDAGGEELEGADAELADAIIALRLCHDAAAVEQLRAAARVTARAHLAGMRATRPGVREAFVRARMEAAIVEHGMCTSYGSIVSVHGEVLHNERHDGVLAPGDLLLADVGAETTEGFAGDVTRSWPVSGRFSPTQRDAYELTLAAQKAAISAVAPGVRYRDIHHIAGLSLTRGLVDLGIFRGDAEELHERGAAALFFPHGIGHLLGLDVHDMEDLGDRAGYAPGRRRATNRADRYLRLDRDLAPGMCVTIEPGFYLIPEILRDPKEVGDLESALDRSVLARFADVRGIRIEDDVLVTDAGYENLSAEIPKDPAEVESCVGGG